MLWKCFGGLCLYLLGRSQPFWCCNNLTYQMQCFTYSYTSRKMPIEILREGNLERDWTKIRPVTFKTDQLQTRAQRFLLVASYFCQNFIFSRSTDSLKHADWSNYSLTCWKQNLWPTRTDLTKIRKNWPHFLRTSRYMSIETPTLQASNFVQTVS